MPRHLMDDLYPSRDERQRTVREMYRRRPAFVLPEHRAPPSPHLRLAHGVPLDVLDYIRERDTTNNKRCQMEGEGPERGGKKAKGEPKDEPRESASEAEGKTPKEEKEEPESQDEPAVKEESEEEATVKEVESQTMLDDIHNVLRTR